MALESDPREGYTRDVPDAETRRPFGRFESTLAMHWDGTYRDRVRNTQYRPQYWTASDAADGLYPAPSDQFAKHLETREETDHRLGYLSGNERELLSDLQHQQF